jgi:uncharacterized membrane protein required for colicin V production
MATIFPVTMLLILFAVVATCFSEGIWSNAVRLVNVVMAGLLAMNFFEPLARWLDDWDKSYTYLWDFLALWGLFAIFVLIFREITDRVSRVKVRFLKVADRVGGVLLSVIVGWVVVCFTMTTLHTAPLGRNFMWEAFSSDTQERMLFGTGPDRQWLGFTRNLSTAAFSRTGEFNEFDPKNDFMQKYATRRSQLEEHIKKTDSLRVGQ